MSWLDSLMRACSCSILVVLLGLVPGCKKQRRPVDDDKSFKGPKVVREMKKAGTWYAADPDRLGAELDRYLVGTPKKKLSGRLVGLVSPHAGYRFSGPTAGYGYSVLGQQRGVRRVIVIGVSHGALFEGISIPKVTHYATPFGLLRLDRAAERVRRQAPFVSVPQAHAREHSVELQMPFIKRVRPSVHVLPMVVGRVDNAVLWQAAKILAPLMDRRTVIVASSDFTHRGGHFRYEVPRQAGESLRDALKRLDFGTLTFIQKLDGPGLRQYRKETGITMCGRDPVALMLNTLKEAGIKSQARVLNYATSGDVVGDWRSTVSYLSIALTTVKSGG